MKTRILHSFMEEGRVGVVVSPEVPGEESGLDLG